MKSPDTPQITSREHDVILNMVRATADIDGDLVELGCYTGDTSIAIAKLLHQANSHKQLYLYDSFAGLPDKSQADQSVAGDNFQAGTLLASKSALVQRFRHANLPLPHIKKAWFSELATTDLPIQISLAFLDGDYYESIRDSLRLVTPLMTAGSKLIIHDYTNPALPGVVRAVTEWNQSRRKPITTRETLVVLTF
jgi:O-methyltransferase